jgi:hypothetical protein
MVYYILTISLCKQVEGTLTTTNAYSIPFELVCVKCNFLINTSTLIEDGMIDCLKCN